MPISTHILDTSTGRPAAHVPVVLTCHGHPPSHGATDQDGRHRFPLENPDHPGTLSPGVYILRFNTALYFAAQGIQGLYPYVEIPSSSPRARATTTSPSSSQPTATPPTAGAETLIEIVANSYGKSRVRLVKVTRQGSHHDLYDWTVEILLEGDFDSAHRTGDNSKLLATDTMKNTVYSVARASSATTIEAFATELAHFLLGRTPRSPPSASTSKAPSGSDSSSTANPPGQLHARQQRAPDHPPPSRTRRAHHHHLRLRTTRRHEDRKVRLSRLP